MYHIIFSNSEKCKISGRTRTPSSDSDGRRTNMAIQGYHNAPIPSSCPPHPVSRIIFWKLRMILLRPSSTEKIDRWQTNASPLPWSFHFCTPSNNLPVYKMRRRGGSKRHSEESINFNLRSKTFQYFSHLSGRGRKINFGSQRKFQRQMMRWVVGFNKT